MSSSNNNNNNLAPNNLLPHKTIIDESKLGDAGRASSAAG